MRLADFEDSIDDIILQRGRDYFIEDRILSISELEKDHFKATVRGGDDYTVEVWLDSEGEIVDSDCDCPYDWGEFCKHQAALLYSLEYDGKKENIPSDTKRLPKQDLNKILKKRRKDELIDIILSILRQYPEIEKHLLFKHLTGAEELAASKKLVREYVYKATHKGFISWDETSHAMEGARQVLRKARAKLPDITSQEPALDSDEIVAAINLCIAVLAIVVGVLEYSDDSSGRVGGVITESIEIINEATSILRELGLAELQEGVFTKIFREALNKRYEGWFDWRLDLLKACTNFCGASELRDTLENQLSEMLELACNSGAYATEYDVRRIKLVQLEIISHFDGADKAGKYIEENIRFSEFREKAIINAFEAGEFKRVLHLCLDGEESEEYEFVVTLMKYRYLAYEKLGDIENQRKAALEILFHNEYEYYLKLKELYQPDEWPTILRSIITRFEGEEYKPCAYVEILIKEGLTSQLLDYCKQNVSEIEDLYCHLINDYFEEVSELFIKHIKQEAEMAGNRNNYKKVCSKIRTYRKTFGRARAEKIIGELKQAHYRRPAFLDELSRIK